MAQKNAQITPSELQHIGLALITQLDKQSQNDGQYFARVDPHSRKRLLQYLTALTRTLSVHTTCIRMDTIAARYRKLCEEVQF